jgi:hypothetical protein
VPVLQSLLKLLTAAKVVVFACVEITLLKKSPEFKVET